MDNAPDNLNLPDEARIIPLGEPIEGGAVLYEGTLDGAREFLASLSSEQQLEVAIWTPGDVFTADQFLAEKPGHEHDPIVE